MARTATIVRETSESKVELSLNLDGTGKTDIDTSVPFYNHMMTALGKHSLIDLTTTPASACICRCLPVVIPIILPKPNSRHWHVRCVLPSNRIHVWTVSPAPKVLCDERQGFESGRFQRR